MKIDERLDEQLDERRHLADFPRPPGIRLRSVLVAMILALLVMTSAALSWSSGQARDRLLAEGLEARVTAMARVLAAQAELGVLVGDAAGLNTLLSALKEDSDVLWAGIWEEGGSLIASFSPDRPPLSPPAGLGDEHEPRLTIDTDTLRIDVPILTTPIPKGHRLEESIFIGEGRRAPEERIGTLSVVAGLDRLREVQASARRRTAISVFFLIILGLMVALPLAWRILRPIQQLVLATHELKHGRFDVRASGSIFVELDTLARAFNQMSESLKQRDERLNENAAALNRQARALEVQKEALEQAHENVLNLNRVLEMRQAQLQMSNEELHRSNRLKSAFLANMSHELRTPLNSIIGFTECMLEGLDGPLSGDQRESLERILRNGRHLLDLIGDILDLARIEAGRLSLNNEKVALAEIGRECLDVVAPLKRSPAVELICDAEDPALCIMADPGRIRQILLNLLGNALDFTDQGEVRLTIRERDADILLEVRDTGCGIPPEDMETIFEPFEQSKGGRAKRGGRIGSGLGLAITRQLVELMGGTIQVDSEHERGTCFTVRLPHFG